ncbi:proton-coupled zinc antiporter SLC30A2-like isoform X2 [Arctopsyche grandis]|uniref:proton-coupled zinc antiporter SLC30A2-like isoform X2 n=1 Tax=Arctopsyche grandis TaxID=121162 RepID=UPI00406D6327
MAEETSPILLYQQETGKVLYGATPSSGENVKRVIYCMHGNPSSRCCAVLDNTRPLPSADEPYGHCHRNRNEEVDKKARRKLIIASILCVLFMIVEIIGGYLSSSLAIATDAAHLLTDFASFMISLFSIWVASRPPTRAMSFGWYRAEVIGALTSVLMIWVVTAILVYMAVERVITKNFEIDATVMLITSSIGVAVNIIMAATLHDHGHSHGHGHGHSHGGGGHSHSVKKSHRATSNGVENPTLKIDSGEVIEVSEEALDSKSHEKKSTNINVRAAYIHVIGDFLQSFGVFIAALVIYYKPEWALVDPICTFLFSILVIFTTFTIIRDTLRVLMEGSPKGLDFQEVCNTFLSIQGVVRVHNLRLWALSLDKTALAAHLAINPGVSPQIVLQEATRLVHEKYNFFEMTLQIEEFKNDMEECNQCKMPDT